jgi:hypothetical protein
MMTEKKEAYPLAWPEGWPRDGRVWAIQSWREDQAVYETASHFVLHGSSYSASFVEGQPRAVAVVPGGSVVVKDGIAVITVGSA